MIPPDIVAAARASHARWGVPASVCIAQWSLESSNGTHMPPGSNNPFGIKASAGQSSVACMTTEHIGGRDIRVLQKFRKFASIAEAFDAHGKLLATSKYYTRAMKVASSPDAFAAALTGVYATDPKYDSKLRSIMKASNLYQYDA